MNRPPLAFRLLALVSAASLMAGFVWWRAWGQTTPTEGQPADETMFSSTKSDRIAIPGAVDSGDPPEVSVDQVHAYSSKSMAPIFEPGTTPQEVKDNADAILFPSTKSAPVFETVPGTTGDKKAPRKPMLLPSTKDVVPLIQIEDPTIFSGTKSNTPLIKLDPETFPSTKSFAPLIEIDPESIAPPTKGKGK